MWSPTGVVVPLAALVFLSACGGRVTTGAPEAQPAAGSAGASNVGGTPSSGGSAPMNEPPDVVVEPPFETPWWLWARWQDNVGNPIADQCKAGLTEAEGLAAITSLGDVTGAVPVDAAGLLATIEQFRDLETREQAPSPIVHLFATLDGHLGAVSVVRKTVGLQVYYFVLSSECVPIRLGFYVEYVHESGCKKVSPSLFPLWGVPELSAELRDCYPTSGYYAFQASTTEDTCGQTPAVFSGAYSYRQNDATHADLVLIDTPFTPLRRTSFGVRFEGETWKAQAKGVGDCGPRVSQVWLESDGQLRVEDERDTCAGDGTQHCTWKMHSPRVYGPLN